jgi:SAM-dependent MidA family methyltransferase
MSTVEAELLDKLKAVCANGPISYRDYIDLSLYADGCGYYKRDQKRVGRSRNTDFYTAESLGQVFAQLTTTAADDLLGKDAAANSTFIEIAAEPTTGLLSHLEKHPFAGSRVIRHGDSIQANGPVVIFANEWLDALPFHRLIFQSGQWRERGVSMDENLTLNETLLGTLSPEVAAISDRLPEQAPEGYQIDLPLLAEAAVADLLAQDWTGLILFFDYGKSWQTLTTECPAGTARTYQQHKQGNDLLDSPGAKDITCDICWDPLVQLFKKADLKSVTLESQEAFFVKRAQRAAEAIVHSVAGGFSPAKQTLMELIHPTHMGQRFQVLWGIRSR